MRSWKSAVKSVVPALARSTWSSPRTSRRVFMPRLCSSSFIAQPPLVRSSRLLLVAGQGAVDECLRQAEIRGGVEDVGRQIEPVEAGGDESVRLFAAVRLCEREPCALGYELRREVRSQPPLAHLEPLERGAHARGRAAGEGERVRERVPLRLPRAGRAL